MERYIVFDNTYMVFMRSTQQSFDVLNWWFYEMQYVCILMHDWHLGRVDTWIASPFCNWCKEVFKQL